MPGLDSYQYSRIIFLLYRHYYHTALSLCDTLVRTTSPSNPIPTDSLPPAHSSTAIHFSFWRGVSLFLLRKHNEAIRHFSSLTSQPELTLAASTALIFVQKRSSHPDNDMITTLEASITMAESGTHSDTAYLPLSTFLALIGDHNESSRWINIALARYPTSVWVKLAHAWVSSVLVYPYSYIHTSVTLSVPNDLLPSSSGGTLSPMCAIDGSGDSINVNTSMSQFKLDRTTSSTSVVTDVNSQVETLFDPLTLKYPKDIGIATGKLLALMAAGVTNAVTTATSTLLGLDSRNSAGLLAGLLDNALLTSDWDRVSEISSRILSIDSTSTTTRLSSAKSSRTYLNNSFTPATLGSNLGNSNNFVPTIEAHLVQFMMAVLRDGNESKATIAGQQLLAALKRDEGDNPIIVSRVLELINRLPRSSIIPLTLVREWMALAERTMNNMSEPGMSVNPTIMSVLASIAMRLNEWTRAKQAYSQVLNIDPHNLTALEGIAMVDMILLDESKSNTKLNCQFNKNDNDGEIWKALHHDIELLASVARSSATTLYLQGEIAWRRTHDISQRVSNLRAAVEVLIHEANSAKGLGIVDSANLMLLEVIVSVLMDTCPARPRTSSPPPTMIATFSLAAEVFAQLYPGSPDAQAKYAWSKYLTGNIDHAREIAKQILDKVPGQWDATQVLIHITLHDSFLNNEINLSHASETALSYLDSALAVNLELRRMDSYQVMRSWIMRVSGNRQESINLLNTVNEDNHLLNSRTLFVYWAERIRNSTGDHSILSKASRTVVMTYPNILIDLQLIQAVVRAPMDSETSLSMLETISNENPDVVNECTLAIADIYLNIKRDPNGYLRSCQKLIDQLGSQAPKSVWYQLALAYQKVDDIDRAIDTLSTALCHYPDATDLHRTIADILLSSHEYARAIEYLQDAVASASVNAKSQHVLELAKVYTKLGYHDRSEVLLMQMIQDLNVASSSITTTGSSSSKSEVESKLWQQLALTQKALGKPSDDTWKNAITYSLTPALRAKMMLGYYDTLVSSMNKINNTEVDNLLEQAHQLDPTSSTIKIRLIQHYLHGGKVDKALLMARELTTKCPDIEEGATLLSQCLIQKRQFNNAIEYMHQALSINSKENEHHMKVDNNKNGTNALVSTNVSGFDNLISNTTTPPSQNNKSWITSPKSTTFVTNYKLLANLIDLLHRMDRMDEVIPMIDLDGGRSGPSGLCYCRGLYFKLKGEIRDAVRQFRRCRADSKWKVGAINHILELLLFPDFDSLDRVTDMQVIQGANKLIDELPQGPYRSAWEALAVYGSRARDDIQNTIDKLRTESESNDGVEDVKGQKESILSNVHVAILLVLAIGYHLLGNTNKVKNVLKQIAAREWDMMDAMWIEAGWLMLARQYLETGKEEAANALVRSCLEVNPHGGGKRAHAVYGIVAEQGSRYEEAVKHWRNAWEEGGRSDPNIGTRLALALLHNHQPTMTIPVIHHTLCQLNKQAGMTIDEGNVTFIDSDPIIHVPNLAVTGQGGSGMGLVPVRLKSDILDKARLQLR